MLAPELFQANLRAGPQLRDDLTGAERAKFSTALQRFSLGVSVQETTGVEISCPLGVHQRSQDEKNHVPA